MLVCEKGRSRGQGIVRGPAEQHCCGLGVCGGNWAENVPHFIFCHRHPSWAPLSAFLPFLFDSLSASSQNPPVVEDLLIPPSNLLLKTLSHRILNILPLSRAFEI